MGESSPTISQQRITMTSDGQLISVIMPYFSFGHPELLVSAVQSVLDQTHSNFELIIVDDASQLPAQEVLKSFDDGRITIVRQEARKLAAAGRNRGISCAKGDFIVPFDADDILLPTYLERVLQKMEVTGCDAVYTHFQAFEDWDFLVKPEITLTKVMCARYSVNTMLYKRSMYEAVGGYFEHLQRAEDIHFLLGALSRGFRFECIEEPLWKYRKHSRGRVKGPNTKVVSSLAKHYPEVFQKHFNEFLLEYEEIFWTVMTDHLAGLKEREKVYTENARLQCETERLEREIEELKRDKTKLENRMSEPTANRSSSAFANFFRTAFNTNR